MTYEKNTSLPYCANDFSYILLKERINKYATTTWSQFAAHFCADPAQ